MMGSLPSQSWESLGSAGGPQVFLREASTAANDAFGPEKLVLRMWPLRTVRWIRLINSTKNHVQDSLL